MTIDLTKLLQNAMPTFSEARLGKIVKGDVKGHPFHGNQYTSAEIATASQKLKDIIEQNHPVAPADLRTVAKIHQNIAQMHKTIDDPSHNDASVQHTLAANNMNDLADKVLRKLQNPQDEYKPYNGGWWHNQRTGEIVSEGEKNRRMMASADADRSLSSAGPRAVRMSLSACNRSVGIGNPSEIQKGDLPGHLFHGNQWETASSTMEDIEAWRARRSGETPTQPTPTPPTKPTRAPRTPRQSAPKTQSAVKAPSKPTVGEKGLPAGWHTASKTDGRVTLTSDKGNSAIFSTRGSWKPGDPVSHMFLKSIDEAATGKTVNFAPKEIVKGGSVLAYVSRKNPDTIEIMPKPRMDDLLSKAASMFGTDPALTALHDSLPKSASDMRSVFATYNLFATPEKIVEAVTLHELGHSTFFAAKQTNEDIYGAVSKALGISTDTIRYAERDGYSKFLGRGNGIGWQMPDGSIANRQTAIDFLVKDSFGSAPLKGSGMQSLLSDGGKMTRYGTSTLQETVAESYCAYRMPELPKTPLVMSLAETLGWTQKAVGGNDSAPATLSDISIADGIDGPVLIMGDKAYDYETGTWSDAWETNPDVVEKGDVQGHPFHGNQYERDPELHNKVRRALKSAGHTVAAPSKNRYADRHSHGEGFVVAQGYGQPNAEVQHLPASNKVGREHTDEERAVALQKLAEYKQTLDGAGFTSTIMPPRPNNVPLGLPYLNVSHNPDVVEKTVTASQLRERADEAEANGDTAKAGLLRFKSIGLQAKEDKLRELVEKGDLPGHEFHGNQYEGGMGAIEAWRERRAGNATPQEPKPADKGGFVGLKTTEIAQTLTNREKWGGSLNTGFDTVRLKDGSVGVVKHNSDARGADAEVLSARIGKAMGVPIRDAEFIKGGQPTDTLHPYIEGKSVAEAFSKNEISEDERRDIRNSPEMGKIKFFDMITGNIDRHWGNVMLTKDKTIVGIDGGNAFGAMFGHQELRGYVSRNKVDPDLVASANDAIQGLFKMKDLTPNQQNIVVNEIAPEWQTFWDNGGSTYAKTGKLPA